MNSETSQLKKGATLILGGARSGKSVFAENMALNSGLKPIYLATARALDESMSERIAIHKERRGDEWKTIEEPLALVDALRKNSIEGDVVLIDCLTLWVTNLMMERVDVVHECELLCEFLKNIKIPVLFISNEVGLGIIPDNAMSRRFQDLAGMVNQQIASQAHTAYFVAAGMPLKIKG